MPGAPFYVRPRSRNTLRPRASPVDEATTEEGHPSGCAAPWPACSEPTDPIKPATRSLVFVPVRPPGPALRQQQAGKVLRGMACRRDSPAGRSPGAPAGGRPAPGSPPSATPVAARAGSRGSMTFSTMWLERASDPIMPTEALIDLEVDLEGLQIGEAGVACAKVVDGDEDAEACSSANSWSVVSSATMSSRSVSSSTSLIPLATGRR